ncbi:MAG TPA: amino acid permease, partial [Gaiellales bacterium]|nr:amino acid permease [Gaiellales bacterium]
LPSVALSALPVHKATAADIRTAHELGCRTPAYVTELACKYAPDPIAGLVEKLPNIPDIVRSGMGYYVAILAATILIIATNAGIIGVSRLTYSMGLHRQLPELLRRVHPRYSTPYVAIGFFSFVAVLLMIPPGVITFLGSLYAFGAMLSFTLAHASVIKLRLTPEVEDMPWRGRLSFRIGGRDIPGFAWLGGLGTGASFLVTIVLSPRVGVVGVGWILIGIVTYVAYRRSQHLPLTVTVKAPAATFGPAVEVEYRSILLPLTSHAITDEMTVTALRLAAESGTKLIALYPIQVPLDRSLSDPMEEESQQAERELREAAALGSQYGVGVVTRIVRTRNVGQAIVDEARRRGSEIIVLGAVQRQRGGEKMFGRVIDYVLRNADCRVMVGTPALV